MTEDEKRMLDLAGQRWNYPGSLEQRVRDEFGISLTRFWQKVGQLCHRQDAIAHSPTTTARLRRIMEVPSDRRQRGGRGVSRAARGRLG